MILIFDIVPSTVDPSGTTHTTTTSTSEITLITSAAIGRTGTFDILSTTSTVQSKTQSSKTGT